MGERNDSERVKDQPRVQVVCHNLALLEAVLAGNRNCCARAYKHVDGMYRDADRVQDESDACEFIV
jgi:hypothetical protein